MFLISHTFVVRNSKYHRSFLHNYDEQALRLLYTESSPCILETWNADMFNRLARITIMKSKNTNIQVLREEHFDNIINFLVHGNC